jgi:DNA-directed RNA polymerase I, II, and III subunit RPABC5
MIIPIRCFTCGKIIAHFWDTYLQRIQEERDRVFKDKDKDFIIVHTEKKTIENTVLNELGIKRYCCRSNIMTTVDMCDNI